MSRVISVVGRSIMVNVRDIIPGGDVLHICGDESDPIIEKVEIRDDGWRLHYRDGSGLPKRSMWCTNGTDVVFVHDLRRERLAL